MIIDREQFKEEMRSGLQIRPDDISADNSPLWLPETEIIIGPPSEWFVQCGSIRLRDEITSDHHHFFEWVKEECIGLVRCYASNGTWDWWDLLTTRMRSGLQ